MGVEIKRSSNLKLYDLCIAINRTSGSTRDLAENLGVTIRTIERRFKRLRQIGIEFEKSRGYEEDTHTAKLAEPLEKVLDRLDRALGIRPYPNPSSLSEEEQEGILEIYQDVLSYHVGHWPYFFFDDDRDREEKLKVVIPYAVENVIKLPFQDICSKHIDDALLSNPKNKHYRGSPYYFLSIAYPWLKQWEIGRVKGIWKGQTGKKRMKEAITWLVEEMLAYPFEEIPVRISRKDFKRHNLDGLLQQPIFRLSPFEAINFAYPGRFKPEQFSGKQKKWTGRGGKQRAGRVTRRIIEEKLEILVDEIPSRLTRTLLHEALAEEGISGLQHVFGMKLYDIINNAYPGKFRRSQFNRSAGHWTGEQGRIRASEELKTYIEQDLQMPLEDIPKKLTQMMLYDNGFLGMMTDKELGFNGSTYIAINNAYPEMFKEWQFKNATNKWKGESGKQNAKEAVCWMIGELGWNLSEVPRKIRVTHFKKYHLIGMLSSKHLGFRNSPYLAITHAYPGRYSKDEFVSCKGI